MSRQTALMALSKSLQNKPTVDQADAVFKIVLTSQKSLAERLQHSIPSEKDRRKVYNL